MKFTSPIYRAWGGMRQRCNNPSDKDYHRYGGRGISVCVRWEDFATFEADMGPRPAGYSIDRRDNNKGYFPENCRWASRKTQSRNTSIVRRVTIEGIEYLAVELADRSGLLTDTIVKRAASGWTYAEVMDPRPRRDLSGLTLGAKTQKSKTHCPRGHEYSTENTRVTKEGWRACRTCADEYRRERRAEKQS